jgi:SRSO17 transposase
MARQYCGQVGKQDNCRVAVSLSVATHQGGLPVAYRLYLPKAWADDPVRRAKAGVPDAAVFQTKPEVALQQVRQTLADGVPPGVVLMDPAYGNDSKLRADLTGLEVAYVTGMLPTTTVWRPGEAPLPPEPKKSGRCVNYIKSRIAQQLILLTNSSSHYGLAHRSWRLGWHFLNRRFTARAVVAG